MSPQVGPLFRATGNWIFIRVAVSMQCSTQRATGTNISLGICNVIHSALAEDEKKNQSKVTSPRIRARRGSGERG